MTPFGLTLRRFREARRLSMKALGGRAGLNYSIVSRWEGGSRLPSRESVERLLEALNATADEADELRVAAGFAPTDPSVYWRNEPVVADLAGLLADLGVPADEKADIRAAVTALVRLARKAAA